jgi:hypothetical protein
MSLGLIRLHALEYVLEPWLQRETYVREAAYVKPKLSTGFSVLGLCSESGRRALRDPLIANGPARGGS